MENFEYNTPNGYKDSKRGLCLTSDNKTPPTYNIKTTYEKCLSLSNADDNVSGFSYTSAGICTIYNPSVGGDITTTSALKGTPITKSSNLASPLDDDKVCYIKENIVPSIYTPFYGNCITSTQGKPNYSTAYPISYNACLNLCDTDSNCKGFDYDSTGKCTLYNPTIFQQTGNDNFTDLIKGDNNRTDDKICNIKIKELVQPCGDKLDILFNTPVLTSTLANPNPINYTLDGWSVNMNDDNLFCDYGYWNGNVNNIVSVNSVTINGTAFSNYILMDSGLATKTLRLANPNYSAILNIDWPVYLADENLDTMNVNNFQLWVNWASNIANEHGFDTFAFGNKYLYFGKYGTTVGTTTLKFDKSGRYTTSGPKLYGTEIDPFYFHAFITNKLKKQIESAVTTTTKAGVTSTSTAIVPANSVGVMINDFKQVGFIKPGICIEQIIPNIKIDVGVMYIEASLINRNNPIIMSKSTFNTSNILFPMSASIKIFAMENGIEYAVGNAQTNIIIMDDKQTISLTVSFESLQSYYYNKNIKLKI
jgi:hypothetical protein